MPLESFLAPVDRWRDAIESALEGLEPASAEDREAALRLLEARAVRPCTQT